MNFVYFEKKIKRLKIIHIGQFLLAIRFQHSYINKSFPIIIHVNSDRNVQFFINIIISISL